MESMVNTGGDSSLTNEEEEALGGGSLLGDAT